MKIALGADHGGFEIKECIKKALLGKGIEILDLGCHGKDSVDYPDYAREVAWKVAAAEVDEGILVCTAGNGMAIAANKFPQVRAALCLTPRMAELARSHNDANVLVLAGIMSPTEAEAVVEAWTRHVFSGAERHRRRLQKLSIFGREAIETASVCAEDPEVGRVLRSEIRRQQETINLIASENYVSPAVRDAQGSVMTNKYAEGYPGKRWYNGCEHVDAVEQLAIERAKSLFGAEHANVQPHCGSSANMAVYFAVLQAGDTILSMNLSHGGHLTHGLAANFSGKLFRIVFYGVERDTERIDYDRIAELARQHKPRMIVAGASSYPRVLDFERFRKIADSVDAYLMVDMAHLAGLVAGGAHPSPVPFADFVTTTTHKTLRGPRSGMILCRKEFAADIDRQVFPGIQGGPLMHTIAAKAVCLHEALRPSFARYAGQIVQNAKTLAAVLEKGGVRLVSGGTDNHLMLVDLTPFNLTGRDAAVMLDKAGIVVNKNVIPFETQGPLVTSGIRIGTPAATTRGMAAAEMEQIGQLIVDVLKSGGRDDALARTRAAARALAARFPVA